MPVVELLAYLHDEVLIFQNLEGLSSKLFVGNSVLIKNFAHFIDTLRLESFKSIKAD